MKNNKKSKPLLFSRATDPNQYSFGDPASWLADESRQKYQREIFWEAIRPLIKSGVKSVLDVGCGSGWMVEKLAEIGITDYVGIEPSEKNYTVAGQLHKGTKIFRNTLADFETEQKFDLILGIMMLSHLGDVSEALKKIKRMLNDNGMFIAIVSRFHPKENRLERNGRKYEVEEIDEEQYVDRSVGGTGYGIADINRDSKYYVREGKTAGFEWIEQEEIVDSGYSAKLLFVMK